VVNIHGSLCTPLDILASNVSLPTAEPGDWVVVYQSGAYGASASPQGFLSMPSLQEVLV
jgi:diaminopimelate decarboxylase